MACKKIKIYFNGGKSVDIDVADDADAMRLIKALDYRHEGLVVSVDKNDGVIFINPFHVDLIEANGLEV